MPGASTLSALVALVVELQRVLMESSIFTREVSQFKDACMQAVSDVTNATQSALQAAGCKRRAAQQILLADISIVSELGDVANAAVNNEQQVSKDVR